MPTAICFDEQTIDVLCGFMPRVKTQQRNTVSLGDRAYQAPDLDNVPTEATYLLSEVAILAQAAPLSVDAIAKELCAGDIDSAARVGLLGVQYGLLTYDAQTDSLKSDLQYQD